MRAETTAEPFLTSASSPAASPRWARGERPVRTAHPGSHGQDAVAGRPKNQMPWQNRHRPDERSRTLPRPAIATECPFGNDADNRLAMIDARSAVHVHVDIVVRDRLAVAFTRRRGPVRDWTAERTTLASAAWKTASNEAVKFDPRSRIKDLMSSNRSPRVRARLRPAALSSRRWGARARRRPAATTDLDVIAAGISLSVSELWHRLCAGDLVASGTRPGGRQGVGTVAR